MIRRATASASAAVLSGALFLTTGCGHTETHEAMLRPPERSSGNPVELYMIDQQPPARPFYEIAIVQAVGFDASAKPEDVAKALTANASKLGCDAVLRAFIDQGYWRAHASGVCVKWLGPAQPGAVAVQPMLPPAPADNPPPPPTTPAPAPKLEALPSAAPGQGSGR